MIPQDLVTHAPYISGDVLRILQHGTSHHLGTGAPLVCAGGYLHPFPGAAEMYGLFSPHLLQALSSEL